MLWHYDLSGGQPIVRDLPVVGTADILLGAVVSRDGAISTALNNFGAQAADATVSDVIGVAAELYDYSAHISNNGTNAATAAATGITNYIKVIINPMAIWLAEWSQNASDDTVNTAADTSGKTVTGTFTSPGDDVEGCWVYITNAGSSAGGAGNLFQIGDASTTVWTACTTFDDNLAGNLATDTYIKIMAPYFATVAGGSINLSTTAAVAGTQLLGNDLVGDDAGAIMSILNWIEDRNTGLQPMRVEKHSGRTFDAATCHIYSDVQLLDHLLLGGGVATAPLIT